MEQDPNVRKIASLSIRQKSLKLGPVGRLRTYSILNDILEPHIFCVEKQTNYILPLKRTRRPILPCNGWHNWIRDDDDDGEEEEGGDCGDEDDVDGGDHDHHNAEDTKNVDGWQEALMWMNGLECWTMSTFCRPGFKYEIPGSRYEMLVCDMRHQETSKWQTSHSKLCETLDLKFETMMSRPNISWRNISWLNIYWQSISWQNTSRQNIFGWDISWQNVFFLSKIFLRWAFLRGIFFQENIFQRNMSAQDNLVPLA